MEVEIITTEDGSHSLYVPELNETYHSKHGSLQEALHIFILNGLWEKVKDKKSLNILEIGFGTGLNALITRTLVEEFNITVNYIGIEAFPVKETIWSALNYHEVIDHHEAKMFFDEIHNCSWDFKHQLDERFNLRKIKKDIREINELALDANIDLVYFDAFGPDIQAELWTEDVFKSCYDLMTKESILMTYSCKGDVRRAMKAAGFTVKKKAGPKGKREISQARKH